LSETSGLEETLTLTLPASLKMRFASLGASLRSALRFARRFASLGGSLRSALRFASLRSALRFASLRFATAVFTESNLSLVTSGKTLVDCATLQVADMQKTNALVTTAGGKFLEAPVSGSKGPAITGTLIFLCGSSSDSSFNDPWVKTCLAAMGKASHFLGEVGNGTKAKLVVNSVMGTMLAAYGEGLNLAESCGIPGATMVEVFQQGACAAPMYGLKGPNMVKEEEERNYDAHFPLKHAWKDMRFAKALAEEVGVEFGINGRAEETFAAGDKSGFGELDFSAVLEEIRKRNRSYPYG